MSSETMAGECIKISLADIVLSVLPWPFHQELPSCPCGARHDYRWEDLGLPGPAYGDHYVCECGNKVKVPLGALILSALPRRCFRSRFIEIFMVS